MANLASVVRPKAHRVLGIDPNTMGIGFCVFWNRRPTTWGKVNLQGSNIYEKILDARVKMASLDLRPDYVVVESAIMVKNSKVAIDLAYVFGSVISEFMYQGAQTITVSPITWQSAIGNKLLTKEEKATIRKNFPGKSESWYTNTGREFRKNRTLEFFNNKWPDMKLDDWDVADACGLSYYGYRKLTKRD